MQQISQPNTNWTDSRRATDEASSESSIVSYEETESIDTLKTALNDYDPITYSEENLSLLNANDLMYAWRLISGNEESFSDYQEAQESQ
jgi:hypothetical protein